MDQTIKKLVLDLSGKGGLSDNHIGSLSLQSSPESSNINFRYEAEDNQFVSGLFNPFLYDGYSAPSLDTSSLVSVTPQVSFTQVMAASQIDEINSNVYFFEAGTKIQMATGLDNVSLTDDRTITNAVGTDLAIYELNGNRSLYYAYHNGSAGFIGVKDITATASPTFTADTGTDYITITGGSWELWENRAVQFTTSNTLPSPLVAGTTYYLKNVSGNTAQVSQTPGGAAENLTTTGTGTHSISLHLDTLVGNIISGGTSLQLTKIKLVNAGDGFLYVLDKNKVHRIDGHEIGGANGTFYSNILQAPEYAIFSHGIDNRGKLYLVLQKNTLYQVGTSNVRYLPCDVGVYIWNRQSSFFNTSDFIPVIGVREVRNIHVAPNGKIRIFCISADRKTQLREFDGTQFKTIKELPPLSSPNYEDSVTIVNNFTVWLGNDGKLWYYGCEKPGDKDILFTAVRVSTDSNFIGGSIAFTQQQDFSSGGKHGFYLSFSESGTETMKKSYPFALSTVSGANPVKAQGDIFTATKYLPRLCNVKFIDIFMAQKNQSSSLTTIEATIKIYFNGSSTVWASKNITRADINKGYISIDINKPYINAIQLEIEHSANPRGTADFMPSFAIIHYDSTDTGV